MQKIPTLFLRVEGTHLVSEEVNPECQWVLDGEGTATRKYDGTACLVKDGKLYKRLVWDAEKGPAPASWLHWDFNPEQRSGHGWFPVGEGPDDWMHRLAKLPAEDGTYELCGPKLQKNVEQQKDYVLIPHGKYTYEAPRTFHELRDWLNGRDIEGIVWHHPDGRMAKIKLRDFGLGRPGRSKKAISAEFSVEGVEISSTGKR